MARKLIKYLVLVIIIGLLAYNSVYIKKLSEVKTNEMVVFKPAEFAQKLWNEKLPARIDSAITLDVLQTTLKSNPRYAFDKYFNSMSIGNIRYGIVRLTGKVVSVNEDDVTVLAGSKENPLTVKVQTEYIYGNDIRDASKLLDIKDFPVTETLNDISQALNEIARTKVAEGFKKAVKKGDSVICTGVIELNEAHYSLRELEIIPVQWKIID